MKPLIRWTVGRVDEHGYKSLDLSIKLIKNLYGDTFDYFVCHNSIEKKELKHLEKYEVTFVEQDPRSLPYPPNGVAWKLYPPRLRMGSHELFIDNDLVVFKRLKKIDQFLSSYSVIYTEGLFGLYGNYKPYVSLWKFLNSGIIGIPPDFDFKAKIEAIIKPWNDYFDEQGLVASIFSKFKGEKICITTTEVAVCKRDGVLPNFTHGCHFCGLNRGDIRTWHKFNLEKRL